jgi:pectate lyase-like protein
VLDLTDMPNNIREGAGEGYPVGLHWQVSQACTLQNIHFKMPRGNIRHRGIWMENGSGGNDVELDFLNRQRLIER